jgi:AraC family transcriptional regulator
MNENMHAEIQGSVIDTAMLGPFRLTESYYQHGLRIDSHSHRCAVFGFILDGFLEQKSSHVDLHCPSGSVFYNPPEIPHTNLTNHSGARCIYMEIPPDWVNRAGVAGTPLQDPASCPAPRIQSLARRIYAEWVGRDDLSPLMIEGLACEVVVELFRARNAEKGPNPPPWLEKIRELVQTRFVEPPSLSELAIEAGVHQVHLARQFRKYFGVTVGEMVRQARVEFARRRLLKGDSAIVQIAFEAGFAHQAHFTTVFKKLVGVTPRQYCMAAREARGKK